MDTPDAGDGRFSLGRRNVLKALGGSAVGVGALTGTASASSSQFYGCSQVCTDTDANHAVVLVDDHYECRILDRYEGGTDRNNVPWGYRSGCYEIGDHEDAVVGVLHDCKLCLNPNNCARNFVDSVEDVVADVEACGLECEEITVGDSCRVYYSNGWPAWTDGMRPGKPDHANGRGDHDGEKDAGPPHGEGKPEYAEHGESKRADEGGHTAKGKHEDANDDGEAKKEDEKRGKGEKKRKRGKKGKKKRKRGKKGKKKRKRGKKGKKKRKRGKEKREKGEEKDGKRGKKKGGKGKKKRKRGKKKGKKGKK